MSMQGRKPTGREIVRGEHDESFIERRMRAFAERSRDPGDATTWAIVLGALMCTGLIFCYAVARQPLMALASFLLTFVWIGVVSRFGRVNVFAVLWGASAADSRIEPDYSVIFRANAVLVAISLLAILVDAVTGWDFMWYSVALLAVVVAYVILAWKVWIAPIP